MLTSAKNILLNSTAVIEKVIQTTEVMNKTTNTVYETELLKLTATASETAIFGDIKEAATPTVLQQSSGLPDSYESSEVVKGEATIVKFDYSLPGLDNCEDLINGVVTKFKSEEVIIARCWAKLGPTLATFNPEARLTSIKLLFKKKAITLYARDTKEYLEWNAGKQVGGLSSFWGPEDPRVFEFKDELYIYYAMTNPHQELPYRGMEYIKFKDVVESNSDPQRGQFIKPNVFGREVQSAEKNWLFFSNSTNIMALYSLKPYILGLIEEDKFDAKIQYEFSCLSRFKAIHFSSNAIKLNKINGTSEYMFIFNDRSSTSTYIPYLGFMEAQEPYHLTRISRLPLHINVNHSKLIYSQSLTVKNSSSLIANHSSIILLSGGVDDKLFFKQEYSPTDLVNLPTDHCYISPSHSTSSISGINSLKTPSATFHPSFELSLVVLMLCLIGLLLYYARQNMHYKKYNRIHSA